MRDELTFGKKRLSTDFNTEQETGGSRANPYFMIQSPSFDLSVKGQSAVD